MFEVKICDVGTLQKPLLMRWWYINTCDTQVFRSFNPHKELIGYCYTLTLSNQKQKLHTITKNGWQKCKSKKVHIYLLCFFCFNRAHWANNIKWMHHTDNRKIIFGHSSQHIPVLVIIMKEYLDLLIEEKGSKQYQFDTFIADIEKIPSLKERKITLYQVNNLINVYNTLFDKNYACWMKEVLLISI